MILDLVVCNLFVMILSMVGSFLGIAPPLFIVNTEGYLIYLLLPQPLDRCSRSITGR